MGRVFKMAVYNLAGVPSIVYGLLGLGIFVAYLGFGFSLISAGLTLSIMTLPLMIIVGPGGHRRRAQAR